MNQERLFKVLIAPLNTEKANNIIEKNNQFTFKVAPDATKAEVKQAVETLFSVKVRGVQMVNVKGKTKRFGRTEGKRPDWKKAYVGLEAGHDINFANYS
jgi:large subunit ribosomal protein L23